MKDASGHGVGGIIVGGLHACAPTVFLVEWPEDIKSNIRTAGNPTGRITSFDLELAGALLLWLVMEEVCNLTRSCHVALFSDNQNTVSWIGKLASKSSLVAGQLIRALALRLKMRRASPLTVQHIRGVENAVTDIPSRSFGSNPAYFCKTHDELKTLFDKKFPLPNQTSWTVFQPSYKIIMRVISVLRMHITTADEWRRLTARGKNVGRIGPSTSNLWEWILGFKKLSVHKVFGSL